MTEENETLGGLLSEKYDSTYRRYENVNKLIYQTLYLSLIYFGAVLIPLSDSAFESGEITQFWIICIFSFCVFLGFVIITRHYTRRRSDLRDTIEHIEEAAFDDRKLKSFQKDTKRVASDHMMVLYAAVLNSGR